MDDLKEAADYFNELPTDGKYTTIGITEGSYVVDVVIKGQYVKGQDSLISQYIHFTQNFAPYDKVTPEIVKKIDKERVRIEAFKDFQIAYAVHTDRDHLHTHFVVNTVNKKTGMKWKQSAEQLQMMKDYSDEICKKYGLIITQGNKGNHINRGEYRTKDKGTSWKYELFLAVKLAKLHSKSKEDFIIKLNQLDY